MTGDVFTGPENRSSRYIHGYIQYPCVHGRTDHTEHGAQHVVKHEHEHAMHDMHATSKLLRVTRTAVCTGWSRHCNVQELAGGAAVAAAAAVQAL